MRVARYGGCMPGTPSRLRPKRFPLLHRVDPRVDEADWIGLLPPGRNVLRGLRVLRRLLPGPAKARFPVFYWFCMCRSIGLHVRVIGAPAQRTAGGRPIVYVSNHSS